MLAHCSSCPEDPGCPLLGYVRYLLPASEAHSAPTLFVSLLCGRSPSKNNLGEGRVYWAYTSTSQSFIKPERSSMARTWGQWGELKRRNPGEGAGVPMRERCLQLVLYGLLSLLSCTSQDHLSRGGTVHSELGSSSSSLTNKVTPRHA